MRMVHLPKKNKIGYGAEKKQQDGPVVNLKLLDRCSGTLSVGTGVMIPYGRHVQTDRILHISEVDRGLACGCVCAACGADLIARRGEVRLPHFAHNSTAECVGAYETTLHKLAKQIIADRMEIYLPEVTYEHKGSTKVVKPGMLLRMDSVSLEEGMDRMRPDIIGRKFVGGEARELLIEVGVTHFCGPEKIELIREMKLACIEIDLSGVDRAEDPEVLAELVVKGAPRAWIYNDLAEKSREQSIQDEMRRKKAQAGKLVSVWRKSFPRQKFRHFQAIIDADLTAAAEMDLPGSECFSKVSQVWQGGILSLFLIGEHNYAGPFRTIRVMDVFRENGYIRNEFEWVPKDVCDLARSIDPSFMSAYEAVEEYLKALCSLGLMSRSKAGWCRNEKASQEARLLIAEAEKARARKSEITDKLNTLLKRTPHSVDVLGWMNAIPPDYTVSPNAAVETGASEYERLIRHLDRLWWMVASSTGGIEENLLGLPLEEILSLRQEEERKRQAAREEREAENKRIALKVAESQRILREIKVRELEIIAEEKREKKAYHFRSQILEEATSHRDADWARFWMGAKNTGLGGRRPKDVCVDQKGLDATRTALLSDVRRSRR